MMGAILVALDKEPGTRPLGIEECWRRGFAKCVLKGCGDNTKAACGNTQLCAGLEAGIEGAFHAVVRGLRSMAPWSLESGRLMT